MSGSSHHPPRHASQSGGQHPTSEMGSGGQHPVEAFLAEPESEEYLGVGQGIHTPSDMCVDEWMFNERSSRLEAGSWSSSEERWYSEGLAESLILRIYGRLSGFAPLEEPEPEERRPSIFPAASVNTMLQPRPSDLSFAIADAQPMPQEEQHLEADSLTSWTLYGDMDTGRPWWHCEATQQSQREPPSGWAVYRDPSTDLPYVVEEATGLVSFMA